MYFGSIEAGGTKFVVAIGTKEGEIIEKSTFPTTSPKETMSFVINFFQKYKEKLTAIGLGSFGPLDVNPNSSTYGTITESPKIKWRNFSILESLKEHFDIPIGFTTDVNIAALGELHFGAAKNLNSFIYLTIGTGIGGGIFINGKLIDGVSTPEVGHIQINKLPSDSFKGICPSHSDCFEGLASGPSIESRWGKKGIELQNYNEVWELEAEYIAQALYKYILILCPEKIILGGGIPKQKQIFPLIRKKLIEINNGYIPLKNLETFITPPLLGDNAGITGGLVLAVEELSNTH